MKKEIYRHGDMIICRVDETELKGQTKLKSLKIGLGEVTGHAHEIVAVGESEIIGYGSEDNLTEEDLTAMDRLIFEIKGECGIITHEEHNGIVLKPGKYVRVHQVEYNPFENQLRIVAD